MNVEDQLHALKKQIEQLNNQKIEIATNIKHLEESKIPLLAECEALGVDPSKLKEVLEQEKAELQRQIETTTRELTNVARA